MTLSSHNCQAKRIRLRTSDPETRSHLCVRGVVVGPVGKDYAVPVNLGDVRHWVAGTGAAAQRIQQLQCCEGEAADARCQQSGERPVIMCGVTVENIRRP